jgi:uncharacterized membrane protein
MYNCGYDLSGDEISCTFTLLCIIGIYIGRAGSRWVDLQLIIK